MKVSIVIPAYNEEEFLTKTLEAALSQNYPDFNVIVVNNASQDRTEEVAQSFPNVHVVTEHNKGILFARERGRQEAKMLGSDIIANLDADCLPPKNWLSRATPFFDNAHVVAVSGPYDYYDSKAFFRKTSLAVQRWIYTTVNKMMWARHTGLIIGGNNLIRTSALEAVGGYNTALTFYGEDTDTAQRIATQGKIIFSKDNIVLTSARRFKDEGLLKIYSLYLYYFWKHGIMPALGLDHLFTRQNRP